jgi:hypothetical protein
MTRYLFWAIMWGASILTCSAGGFTNRVAIDAAEYACKDFQGMKKMKWLSGVRRFRVDCFRPGVTYYFDETAAKHMAEIWRKK